MNPTQSLVSAFALAMLMFPFSALESSAGLPTNAPANLELVDQFGRSHKLSFPATNVTVLAVADRKGAEQVDGWIEALKQRYRSRIMLEGIANVDGAPTWLHARISKQFRDKHSYPVMLDWSGKVASRLGSKAAVANLFVLAPDGRIYARFSGPATESSIQECAAALDRLLEATSSSPNSPRATR